MVKSRVTSVTKPSGESISSATIKKLSDLKPDTRNANKGTPRGSAMIQASLIACEKTRRKCFMMELSPAYCDVIVTRWQNATGGKAVLHGSAS